MRWLAVAIVALLMGRPMTAQTPKAKELVGQWRRQTDTAVVVTFTDSTFTFPKVAQAQINGKTQPIDVVTRWSLTKDTLTFIQPRLKAGTLPMPQQMNAQAKQVFANDTLRLLTLKGHVLTMKTRDGKRTYVYERVGGAATVPATGSAKGVTTSAATSTAVKSERYNPLIEHP